MAWEAPPGRWHRHPRDETGAARHEPGRGARPGIGAASCHHPWRSCTPSFLANQKYPVPAGIGWTSSSRQRMAENRAGAPVRSSCGNGPCLRLTLANARRAAPRVGPVMHDPPRNRHVAIKSLLSSRGLASRGPCGRAAGEAPRGVARALGPGMPRARPAPPRGAGPAHHDDRDRARRRHRGTADGDCRVRAGACGAAA